MSSGLGSPLTDEPTEAEEVTAPVATLRWWRTLPLFVAGDIDAYIVVFGNNLATMLIAVGLVVDKIGEDHTYNYMVPGIAVSMAFGCIFYVMQAQLKSRSTGRVDLCAQPFGINTPCVLSTLL